MSTIIAHFLDQLHKFHESQWRIEKDPEGNWIILQTVDRILIYIINYMLENKINFLRGISITEYTNSGKGTSYILTKTK